MPTSLFWTMVGIGLMTFLALAGLAQLGKSLPRNEGDRE
jgi:hypothetical protein